MKSLLSRLAAFACAAASLAANAGGPLSVCSSVATKYPGAGTIVMNYDLGALGSRSNAAAAAIVNATLATWTNVSTSTVSMTRGADLPVDVTTANYTTYLGGSSYSDGRNPVVYDTDGTIIDLLLGGAAGSGASNSILGFAGSAWFVYPTNCQYAEGRAVINGKLAISDATMTTTIAHELGHFIGLDHSQIDSAQGLSSANYPLMYPIAYRSAAGLHEDDIAAVTALYPDSNVNSVYGTLTGTFVTAGGTPIRGANIWARNTTTGQHFSVVSDYLMQGTGYFRLLLTPGTYTLHAEAIDTSFTEGSGVGPYSDDLTGLSFQPPNYTGANGTGTALNVAMISPATIAITAGCSASVTFRSSGTGTMGTTCAPATPPVASTMTSPAAGSTLAGSSVTFTWTAGSGQTARYLIVGTTQGGQDLFSNRVDTILSQSVTNVPTDGRTIYVQLSSFINSAWQTNSYTYTASSGSVTPPPPATAKSTITSPAAGSTLAGASATFTWSSGSGSTARYFMVGTTRGGQDLFSGYATSNLSQVVNNIPTDGRTIYASLGSYINNAWQSDDKTFTAANISSTPPVVAQSTITSPAAGSTLPGSSATLAWTAGTGLTARYLTVGTTPGGQDLFSNHVFGSLSQTITGIPTDGRTIYVNLSSYINNAWQSQSVTYVAASGGSSPPPASSGKSTVTTPSPGSTVTGATMTLGWTAGSGLTARYLTVGTTPGGQDLFSNHVGSQLSATVNMPRGGRTVYVSLNSYINNAWQVDTASYVSQ